ncbi:hypothetical protein [Dyella sp.]|uniref:hypothetical protein n=1 Tax=Dyella sp. TaxID=1869338 RepID=UPI002D792B30|nr:hypothetical protein [Dyella sp.]HET6433127.1 hypothetical protein [Dyella sp.]
MRRADATLHGRQAELEREDSMSQNSTPPKKSGYDESHPKDPQGGKGHPAPDAPRQPQNDPDAKPQPSS